ncbi:hypothetical protein AAU61_18700 [Desulfocarbo indianensis]|nr:hypothetical protein AAU61_18700 [Desulfocarbo indianensis]
MRLPRIPARPFRCLFFLLLTATLLALASPALADDHVWRGSHNEYWSIGGNWDPVGLFPGIGDTVVFDGTTVDDMFIDVAAPSGIKFVASGISQSFIINGSASLSLSGIDCSGVVGTWRLRFSVGINLSAPSSLIGPPGNSLLIAGELNNNGNLLTIGGG